MKISKISTLVLVVLVLSGCGDQFWCGEDGCNLNRASNAVTPAQSK